MSKHKVIMKLKTAFLILLSVGLVLAAAGVFFGPVRALTWVEGHITTDTIWTVTESPYRAINDVIIDPGVLLTIEPGVEVQFADGFSLFVEGSLIATGTEVASIVFTSSRVSPSPGAWNTIQFKGYSNEQLLLKHVNVEYAIDGVTVMSQGLTTIEVSKISNCSRSGIKLFGKSNVIIKQNTIRQNGNGIVTDDSVTHAGVTVIDNEIRDNQGNGVYIHSNGGNPKIYNVTFLSNSILSNGDNGVHFYTYWTDEHIYDITFLSNNISSNGRNGIFLYARHIDTHIYNVTFSSNTISSNGDNGIYLDSTDIHNTEISSNTISSNGDNGIYLDSYMYNVTFSSNTISSNDRNGVHLCSSYRIINVTFSSNIMSSNMENGVYAEADNSIWDLEMSENTVSANYQNGVGINGAPNSNSNLSHNSISSNSYGVFYARTQNNLAKYNDIYYNSYGMNVTNGAAVNAEQNYWGHSTGPYHPSLNPEGEGNSVNGDGTDLDFIPWSSSLFGPIIEPQSLVVSLSVTPATIDSGGEVSVDVHVTNGTVAIDDVVIQLASDKGGSFSPSSGNTDLDGDFVSAYTAPTVSEETTVKITATASKSGYTGSSDNRYLTVVSSGTLLSVTITAEPNTVQSGETSTLTVRVTDGTNPVADASVALSSDKGGTFTSASGTTDSSGYFTSVFAAPTVTEKATCTITANATKTGYYPGQAQTQIAITVTSFEPWLLLLVLTIVVIIIITGAWIIRRRRQAKSTVDVHTQH